MKACLPIILKWTKELKHLMQKYGSMFTKEMSKLFQRLYQILLMKRCLLFHCKQNQSLLTSNIYTKHVYETNCIYCQKKMESVLLIKHYSKCVLNSLKNAN